MRQRIISLLPPNLRKDGSEQTGCCQTNARGMEVLAIPLLNKGSAFTEEEREALGLTGLLPPIISTLDVQAKCVYLQYQRLPDALE